MCTYYLLNHLFSSLQLCVCVYCIVTVKSVFLQNVLIYFWINKLLFYQNFLTFLLEKIVSIMCSCFIKCCTESFVFEKLWLRKWIIIVQSSVHKCHWDHPTNNQKESGLQGCFDFNDWKCTLKNDTNHCLYFTKQLKGSFAHQMLTTLTLASS